MSISPDEFLRLCAIFGVQTGGGGAPGSQYLLKSGGNMTGTLTTDATVFNQIRTGYLYSALAVSGSLSPQDSNFIFEFTAPGVDFSDTGGLIDYTDGFQFALKNTSGGACTFTPLTGEFIDGQASFTLLDQQGAIIVKTASQWSVIANGTLGAGVTAAQIQAGAFTVGIDSGVADAYVVTTTPPISALSDGMIISFTPLNTSTTTSPTVDVGFGGVLGITGKDYAVLSVGDLVATIPANLQYNVSDGSWQLLNPQTSAGGGGVTPLQVQNSAFNVGSCTGAADNYVVTCSPAITSYADGMIVIFKPSATSTATNPQLDAGGGVYPITYNSHPLVAGDLNSAWMCICQFNDLFNEWHILNPIKSAVYPEAITTNIYASGVESGTADNYVVTPSPIWQTTADNAFISFVPGNTNTTASLLNVAGLLNTDIVKQGQAPLVAGDLVAGTNAVAIFQGASGKWMLLNPQTSSGGGSSPWSAGAAANSAIGGTTSTCASINGLAYGDNNVLSGSGNNSVMLGGDNNIGGGQSCAIMGGSSNNMAGAIRSAILAGQSNIVQGDYSWVGGQSNTMNGSWSGGGGLSNTITNAASYAFIFGQSNTITGSYSVAFGNQSDCDQQYSFSMGFQTKARGNYQFVFGSSNTRSGASANNCFVFGDNCTTASAASFSFAFGSSANVNNAGSWVVGDSNATPVSDSAANQMNFTFAGGYRFFNTNSGGLAVGFDSNGNFINGKGTADQSYSLQTPTTGSTITIAGGVKTLVINPASLLAALTIVMPASPINGQEIVVAAENFGVTSLTVSGNTGQTISNAPTTLAAGQGFKFQYNLANTNWMPIYRSAVANPITLVNEYAITATGAFTYTPTAGTQFADFELQAGGGGAGGTTGAGGQSAAGGPGGGGANQKIRVTGAANLAAITGSVGIAGAAGAAGNNAGSVGGDTTLTINGGSVWTAGGGGGGGGQTSSASAQTAGSPGGGGGNGSGTNGTLILAVAGQTGSTGFSNGVASANLTFPTIGGSSARGMGGQANFNSTGNTGTGYGAGAGGGMNVSAANADGAPGTQGVVIVTEFISG